MDITPAIPEGRLMVDSYGPGRFKIRGTHYPSSILLFPDRVETWPVIKADDLTLQSLSAVQAEEPPVEVLLLGTGSGMHLIPSSLRSEIRAAGLIMDIMDTGAACRTFNILMTEGRRAAAALIALDEKAMRLT